MTIVNEMREDYVIVETPRYRLRSGKEKYRFFVLVKGKVYLSDYRFKTEDNARTAGEKYLKGV